ncbi:YopX family protein [Enterococcus faecium]|uniref:YopX family protein n=1 Tax=Enterococcus faecium TaxID=1352 RepID=UPI000FFC5C22|nr:YopX family protein [Enterococcus faecium]RXD19341.1 hypothetical protein EAS65_09115 [Enterococcus faecium]
MIPRYRVWDKQTERMHIVSGIDFNDGLVSSVNIWHEGWPWVLEPDEIVLMQSTGLKDKNGVGIFEGDVVAVENHPFQRKEDSGVGMEIEGNYVVGWNQHDLTWCAGDLLLARLKPYVKVIGNIYENSELLEEQR